MDAITVELTAEIRARRVAVCKDVLAQYWADKLFLGGCYLSTDYTDVTVAAVIGAHEAGNKDLQSIVDVIAPSCMVCALGALLLSKARIFNAVPIDMIFDEYGEANVDQDRTAELLADTFDVLTLSRIEAAFEVSASLASSPLLGEFGSEERIRNRVSLAKASDWASKSKLGRPEILLALMHNIIANNGEFILPPTEGDDDDE